MGYILKNKNLEIQIDLPLENYNFSRFDWTGKIVKIKFQNILISSIERTDSENEHLFGKGFYNEFGIDNALGFEEAKTGDWFHKIGIGLLKKDDQPYLFNKKYEVRPADFKIKKEPNRIIIICKSEVSNGYSYLLTKEIELLESGFHTKYNLQNTGEKNIITDEYAHNFTSFNKEAIGSNYILKFPFELKPKLFGESVNPEQKVEIKQHEVKFSGSPKDEFFFSNLSGNEKVEANWELINLKSKIGVSETGNFQTKKINLWGWKHVISPELFFNISIKPDQTIHWSRTYNVFKIN